MLLRDFQLSDAAHFHILWENKKETLEKSSQEADVTSCALSFGPSAESLEDLRKPLR